MCDYIYIKIYGNINIYEWVRWNYSTQGDVGPPRRHRLVNKMPRTRSEILPLELSGVFQRHTQQCMLLPLLFAAPSTWMVRPYCWRHCPLVTGHGDINQRTNQEASPCSLRVIIWESVMKAAREKSHHWSYPVENPVNYNNYWPNKTRPWFQ